MNEKPLLRWRVYITVLVLLAEFAQHLDREHFHGDMMSHNVLNRRNLRVISNAWGALLLSALTRFSSGFGEKRIASKSGESGLAVKLRVSVVVGFVGALLSGALLAGSLANH